MSDSKSSEKSESLRKEGNKLYSDHKFYAALLNYNESLCYAKPDSENLGLAYANRSAVYFEMKLYENGLKNIDLAKANHYPEKNFDILDKRGEKCKELLNNRKSFTSSNPWNFFKLSHQPHKRLSYIVNSLELRTNEKFGRHIVTNKPLKAGDIIAIESPFCGVLLSESKFIEVPESNIYQRCSNCMKENAMDLIPCSTCCKGKCLITTILID